MSQCKQEQWWKKGIKVSLAEIKGDYVEINKKTIFWLIRRSNNKIKMKTPMINEIGCQQLF